MIFVLTMHAKIYTTSLFFAISCSHAKQLVGNIAKYYDATGNYFQEYQPFVICR